MMVQYCVYKYCSCTCFPNLPVYIFSVSCLVYLFNVSFSVYLYNVVYPLRCIFFDASYFMHLFRCIIFDVSFSMYTFRYILLMYLFRYILFRCILSIYLLDVSFFSKLIDVCHFKKKKFKLKLSKPQVTLTNAKKLFF